jgi:sugar/nucleoside kinase (ribokinase family)
LSERSSLEPAPPLDPRAPARARAAELDVVGIGQSSLDRVCLLEAPPPLGGKASLLGSHELPGGQIATAMLACARLGLRAAYVGTVGDDAAAEAVLAPLARAGVDLRGVQRVAGAPTRSATVLVDARSGERTILGYRDPRLALSPEDLEPGLIEGAACLHLDAVDPEASGFAADVAHRAGVPVVLDADSSGPGLEKLLAKIDFPIVSRGLAEAMGGQGGLRGALSELCALGARVAVVTLGEYGALARHGERVIESPAFRVDARDTTGAGDVFHAAFVWGLLEGLGCEAILRAANAAAAMSCRSLGAQGGLPTRAELEAFLREQRPAAWREPEGDGR